MKTKATALVPHHAQQLLKYFLTALSILIIPAYVPIYGPQNFLWLSDVGLFLTILALWLESPLLISIAAISVLPAEILWNIDFFIHLLTGINFFDMSNYMFNPLLPLWIRIISLFHIALPILWIRYLFLWGYDRRALIYATALVWADLALCYLFTTPGQNINAAFLATFYGWSWISPFAWIILFMVGYAIFLILPMHVAVTKISKAPSVI